MDATDQTETTLSEEEIEVLQRHADEATEVFEDALEVCMDEQLDLRVVLPAGLTMLAIQILARSSDRDTGLELIRQHIQNAVDMYDAAERRSRGRLC